MDYVLGIDLGGTKIEAALLDKTTFEVVDRKRIDTEASGGYDHILGRIAGLIQDISTTNQFKPIRVGMATPGTRDPQTGLMKNCNTTVLNGRPMKEDLSRMLGMELVLSNDANCFAIAETKLGIVRDKMPEADVVFGVIMGTGVGGGLVVNGMVVGGRQGIGGEWGHNFLDESGGPCYCGKTGCVERMISGPALEAFYAKISGTEKKLKNIVEEYRQGNSPFASQTMERLFENFGKAISVVINIVDPDVIVIGGGVGNIDELYTEGVERVKKHVFNHKLDTVFMKPKLGDSAGVYGAAML
ncbi:MAG: ROK family protein [Saprospiraceae bacterium]|nr:ROK family protein [Saprospiraceae bacterium]